MNRSRQIKAKANHSKRTFTLIDEGLKFRTNKMNKEEFQESLYRTSNDWINYLKHSNDYYMVK